MLEHLDLFFSGCHIIQRACHFGTRRIPLRVHDTAAAVTALTPKCERAIGIAVEFCTMFDEPPDIIRPLTCHDARDLLIGQSGSGHERILHMKLRIVILAKRSRNASLRLIRIAVPKRIAYHKQHMAASTRCRPGCLQPRNTRANDQKLCTLCPHGFRRKIHQITLHVLTFL